MATKVRYEAPKQGDARYTIWLPPTGDKFKDLFPFGWAKKVPNGFEFWTQDMNRLKVIYRTMSDLLAAVAHEIDSKSPEDKIMEEFLDLTSERSPENLTCDGELSRSQVQKRLQVILSKWRVLEAKLGRTMTEDQVWAWYQKKQETSQTRVA